MHGCSGAFPYWISWLNLSFYKKIRRYQTRLHSTGLYFLSHTVQIVSYSFYSSYPHVFPLSISICIFLQVIYSVRQLVSLFPLLPIPMLFLLISNVLYPSNTSHSHARSHYLFNIPWRYSEYYQYCKYSCFTRYQIVAHVHTLLSKSCSTLCGI